MSVSVGIVRVQTPFLTKGHKALLDEMYSATHVIVLLGVAKVLGTENDPLDFETRRLMVQGEYPRAICLPLYNMFSDESWSKQVDKTISNLFPYERDVILYHSRDSFKKSYSGRFKTQEVPEIPGVNATELRRAVKAKDSVDFREGVIYGAKEKFPRIVPCVDFLAYDPIKSGGKIIGIRFICGRKEDYEKWLLPGGHIDIEDEDVIDAGLRELFEEVGIGVDRKTIKIHSQIMLKSKLNSKDVRYMTTLLSAEIENIKERELMAGDDFSEVAVKELYFDNDEKDFKGFDIGHVDLLKSFIASLE